MTSVIWFRRDLRLADHPALLAAIERGPAAALYVLDPRLLGKSSNRTAFLFGSLRELAMRLRGSGNQLCVRMGDPRSEVPKFAAEAQATDVFFSRDYTPFARRRDAFVQRELARSGIDAHGREGTLLREPEEIATREGKPFGVFTPFLRRWREEPPRRPLPAPTQIPGVSGLAPGEVPTLESLGLPPAAVGILEAGESAAAARLAAWASGGIFGYTTQRDLLAKDGTSRLSQDLKWGLLSPAQVLAALPDGADSERFTTELAWRDFYQHVLWHHPRVVSEPYQRQFGGLRWGNNRERTDAWKAGLTGYPVVDAAMRQLVATGFMHNRARMVVASFLTKHLDVDWRIGAAHFMQHLVDGDTASNNGGWQWAASTGTDAQPFFRVFNPMLQGQRFDPDGEYVRRWLPELAGVPKAFIHEPWTMPVEMQRSTACVIGEHYPPPIVEHAVARELAIRRYREARAV